MLMPLVALVSGFAAAQLANLVTTIYLHRALAHRSLRLAPGLVFACRVLIWISTGIRPREWAAVHRRHHAFTDTEGDPHSPLLLGWARVQLTTPKLYRRAARDGVTVQRYARDIPHDRWDKVLFDHSGMGLVVGLLILMSFLGPVGGTVAGLFHVVVDLALSGAVNSIAHTIGRRPADNSATNVQ